MVNKELVEPKISKNCRQTTKVKDIPTYQDNHHNFKTSCAGLPGRYEATDLQLNFMTIHVDSHKHNSRDPLIDNISISLHYKSACTRGRSGCLFSSETAEMVAFQNSLIKTFIVGLCNI